MHSTGAATRRRGFRALLLAGAVQALITGCFYGEVEQHRAESPTTRPWFCDGNGEGSPGDGHGNGEHVDPFYVGTTKGQLLWSDCEELSHQFDQVLTEAMKYPTRKDAEADGWVAAFNYVPGLGTHHIRPGGLNFDPGKAGFLMYDGNGPDAKLVGTSWVVFTTDDKPPAGFAGTNDWWHTHKTICFGPPDPELPEQECIAAGGTLRVFRGLFMIHAWIIPGFEYKPDVFISEHPCLGATGRLPESDPCWKLSATEPAAMRTNPPMTVPTPPGAHGH